MAFGGSYEWLEIALNRALEANNLNRMLRPKGLENLRWTAPEVSDFVAMHSRRELRHPVDYGVGDSHLLAVAMATYSNTLALRLANEGSHCSFLSPPYILHVEAFDHVSLGPCSCH